VGDRGPAESDALLRTSPVGRFEHPGFPFGTFSYRVMMAL